MHWWLNIFDFRSLLYIALFVVHTAIVCDAQLTRPATATSVRGVLATVQPLATSAGVQVFQDGGNAVDAAISAALTLGVVDSHNSGLGGGCFILIRQPGGQLLAIDGRETAPAAATADMYVRDGQAMPELSQTGPLAVAVPGALAAYQRAMSRCGRLSLDRLLHGAAEIAARGHAIDRVMAGNLGQTAAALRDYPASRAVLLKPDGSVPDAGDLLVQADLANTYRMIAEQGTNWFYGGLFARQIDQWMAAHGGLLTAKDFSNYQALERQPIVTDYRGYTIVGFPPPSSGGVHVAQILNILANFNLRQLHEQDPALMMHVVAEAMKLAFVDRAFWLGDSDFVPVPRGLLDAKYARQLAARIQLDRPTPVAAAGQPEAADINLFGKHTTHIAAADSEGYWVAITATINTSFGSKVIVPGTGLLLNNQMDDFSSQPGVPNAFGLIGNRNNAIAPRKRPLSSMSPTIILKDGQPIITLGAAGGPTIISQVVLGIIQAIDLQLPIDQCVANPRWHHQWQPDRLFVEQGLPDAQRQRLSQLGHAVSVRDSIGAMQAIMRTADGQFVGIADPRIPGQASGF